MTIGKSSRKASVRSSIRAPKFLDKASGFYGRLDEPETVEDVKGKEVEQNGIEEGSVRSPADEWEEVGLCDFSGGIVGDDGETLLQRKPSRHSSRWRRSSRRKLKEGKGEQNEKSSLEKENSADETNRGMMEAEMEKLRKAEEENEKAGKGRESALVHFPAREDADDQVLIRDKKTGREEEAEEKRNLKSEQEKAMKVVKRNTMKNYHKVRTRTHPSGCFSFLCQTWVRYIFIFPHRVKM